MTRSDTETTVAADGKQPRRQPREQFTVPFFGDVYRLGGGNDQHRSFVDRMGVPTFATALPTTTTTTTQSLEAWMTTTPTTTAETIDSVQPGPAGMIHNVLSEQDCRSIIQACEEHLGFADFCAGKNHHGALQIIVPKHLVDALTQRLAPHIDMAAVQRLAAEMEQALGHDGTNAPPFLCLVGLNRRWRVYRYAPGGAQSFAPHIDAAFPPSGLTHDGQDLLWDVSNGQVVSRLTFLLYLNHDFDGGETVFYAPSDPVEVVAAVRPVTGSVLLFPQAVGEAAVDIARQTWPLHEGSPVTSGPSPKYVIRSDVLFTATINGSE